MFFTLIYLKYILVLWMNLLLLVVKVNRVLGILGLAILIQ